MRLPPLQLQGGAAADVVIRHGRFIDRSIADSRGLLSKADLDRSVAGAVDCLWSHAAGKGSK